MKKVLFVATVVETHIKTFHIPYLKMFKDRGWQTVVAAKNDCRVGRDRHIPFCDEFYDIPFQRFPLKIKNLEAFVRLRTLIKNGNFDIIHCHTPVGALLTRLAAVNARKKGTKIIYTAHGFHFYRGAPLINWMVYYPVEWLLANFTDVLITINQEDYARACRFNAKCIHYVNGVGIDTKRFKVSDDVRNEWRQKLRIELDIPTNATVLLSVGELTKRKNHGLIIRAVAQLERADVYYVICGRGPLLDKYNKLIRKLKVENRVRLLGFCEQIEKYYSMSDIFVFPSRQEGLPVALMEAMVSKLPIICSAIRGNTDLIRDGDNGLLVENDDVSEYVKAIENYLDNDYRLAVIEVNAKETEKYDIHTIQKEYHMIYFGDKEE